MKNKSLFDPKPQQDIGYMYNQYSHAPWSERLKTDWPWQHLEMWWKGGDYPSIYTWLYNDVEGNVVMHVTEMHEFYYRKENKNYVPYKKFMQNYKPIFSRIIPHQTAREWLARCEYLLGILEEAEDEFKRREGWI